MTRVGLLAEVYSLPPDDVARWPVAVQIVLHRNAIRRGWLVPEITDNAQEQT